MIWLDETIVFLFDRCAEEWKEAGRDYGRGGDTERSQTHWGSHKQATATRRHRKLLITHQKIDHIDKFPTSTTRGKTGETHHWEAGREASGGCVSVWHKASVFPGLWKRICTIPAAAALVVGRGSLILCTSAASSAAAHWKTATLNTKITSKCPLRCNTAQRRDSVCHNRSPSSCSSLLAWYFFAFSRNAPGYGKTSPDWLYWRAATNRHRYPTPRLHRAVTLTLTRAHIDAHARTRTPRWSF